MTRPTRLKSARMTCILLAGLAATPAFAAPLDGAGQASPAPAAAPAVPGPRMLRFAPETIEFGEVDPGKPVTAKLTITNVSDAPITVEGIKGGCGCTTVSAPPREPVAPGASFTVDVTMDPGAKPGVALVKPMYVTVAGGAVESMQIKAKVKGTPVPAAEKVTLFRLPVPAGPADRASVERTQDDLIRGIDSRVAADARSAQFRMRLHRESGMLFVHGDAADIDAVRAAVKALPAGAGVRESQGEPGA
jgi:hypothetical protein